MGRSFIDPSIVLFQYFKPEDGMAFVPEMHFHRVKHYRTIGIEYEFPVVTPDGKRGIGKNVFPVLLEKGWTPEYDIFYPDELIGVTKNGVALTTEAGLGILELVLPPARHLHELKHTFYTALTEVILALRASGMIALGYGIQPLSPPETRWNKKRRYERLREAVAAYCNGPGDINKVTVAASAQVHVSVTRDEVALATNVFNALSGVLITMFANAPIWNGAPDADGSPAVRERFWEFAPERTGIPPKFSSLEHVIQWFGEQQILLLPNGSDYSIPQERTSWNALAPELQSQSAWQLHEGTIWPNARPRTRYGTIEVRPVCSQGKSGMMTLAAFTLGVAENLPEASMLVDARPWDEWRYMRECALLGKPFTDGRALIERVVAIAIRGLLRRPSDGHLGITLLQKWLREPSPATRARDAFNRGGIPGLVAAVRL